MGGWWRAGWWRAGWWRRGWFRGIGGAGRFVPAVTTRIVAGGAHRTVTAHGRASVAARGRRVIGR